MSEPAYDKVEEIVKEDDVSKLYQYYDNYVQNLKTKARSSRK